MTASQAAAVPAPLRAPVARLLELDIDRRARVWHAVRAAARHDLAPAAELTEAEQELALELLCGLLEAAGGEVPPGVRRHRS